MADQVVAWNAGDGLGLSRHLEPDASSTNLFGMVLYRAPALANRNADILNFYPKGSTKQHAIRRIRLVTRDVGIVDIDNELRGAKSMHGGMVVLPDGVVKTQLAEVFIHREGRHWIKGSRNVELKSAK